MNQREMEKQIWASLFTIARNFYDFDRAEYERIRHGFENDDWDYRADDPRVKPLTTEKHQERFDRAMNRVIAILNRKAIE